MATQTELLINNLMDPDIYPHPCDHVELVETHISWVLLTGFRAYKIKKPVDLGFVDFTSLARRFFYCEEELRLNRRLAPELYLEVVPITGSVEQPRIGGAWPVIEYAVSMVQFDQSKLLSKLPAGKLLKSHIDALADRCAEFHTQAEVARPDTRFGNPEQVLQSVRSNFDVLKNLDPMFLETVQELEQQVELESNRLKSVFAARKQDGKIRECHGDLHLGNMFLLGDEVIIFDGIEFNDEFRWIDVMSDIAFTVMDLQDRGYQSFSNRLINRWLERTGDYEGLGLLPFYCSYRAAVRAKVDAIRMQQPHVSEKEHHHLQKDCAGYLELAQRYMQDKSPALMITMGPSGSGKTTVTQQLIETTPTIRIRSDVERKRLYGLKPEEKSDSTQQANLYSSEASMATYERLEQLAQTVIESGYPVVVDATFLRQSDRERFLNLAQRLDIPFHIIECQADETVLKTRIRERHLHSTDASEADEAVLEGQLKTAEWLTPSEKEFVLDPGLSSLSEHVFSLSVKGHA